MSIPVAPETLARQPTRFLYLADPGLCDSRARVLSVHHEEDGSVAVVLDQTPFYPQQGGQPSDVGRLRTGTAEIAVMQVRANGGMAVHCGRVVSGTLAVGEEVVAEIEAGLRQLHTRIHSAGELLCAVAGELGVGGAGVLSAIHHPGRAAVDFSLQCVALAAHEFGARLEDGANRRIARGGAVRVATVADLETVTESCGYRPDYLPEGQEVRIVFMDGPYGRPCLGTHVTDISEIGAVRVRKVKTSKNRLRVSYCIDGMLIDP